MRPNAASKLVPIQHVLEESDGGGEAKRARSPDCNPKCQPTGYVHCENNSYERSWGKHFPWRVFSNDFVMYLLMYIECPFKAVVGSFTVFTCVNKPRPQEVHERRTGSGEEVQCDTPTVSAPKNKKWGRDLVWHTHRKCTKEPEVGQRFCMTHRLRCTCRWLNGWQSEKESRRQKNHHNNNNKYNCRISTMTLHGLSCGASLERKSSNLLGGPRDPPAWKTVDIKVRAIFFFSTLAWKHKTHMPGRSACQTFHAWRPSWLPNNQTKQGRQWNGHFEIKAICCSFGPLEGALTPT